MKRLKKQLARDAEKGKRTETEVKSVISRISISQTLEEAEHADIVIEAIAENMAAKTEMFKTLDRICRLIRFWPAIHLPCLLQKSLL